ncbi:GNAT family N-acetyltransferase [Actinosynnema sp. NPDC050801]|uniref:GNAT family N-acetyltransferase n=1 Tax=unclassified Actinosynnema TaxID=2637065 RepID=UPI0033DEB11E
MREWVLGWSLCRDAPEPVEEPDGFRIDVGLPGHRVRFVLAGTASVRERAVASTEPGTWLKICGRRADVVPLLGPGWVVGAPEFLMSTTPGDGPAVPAPDGYRTEVVRERRFHEVVVTAPDGGRAARGRFAVHGGVAVVDQVVTEPAHRRRGLGRCVMGTIGAHARDRGAGVAVLVATVEGRHLYESLGWWVDSEVVAAHRPDPAAPHTA